MSECHKCGTACKVPDGMDFVEGEDLCWKCEREELEAENTRLREKLETTMSKPISNDQREFQEQNAATDQRNLNSDRWEALEWFLENGGSIEVVHLPSTTGKYHAKAYRRGTVAIYSKQFDTAPEALTALADLLVEKRYERGEGNG